MTAAAEVLQADCFAFVRIMFAFKKLLIKVPFALGMLMSRDFCR